MATSTKVKTVENDLKEMNIYNDINGSPVGDNERKEAENKKSEANKYFKEGNYEKAVDLYAEAIKLNPFEKTYWTNRSAAHLKREFYGSALADAVEAIRLDKTFAKGYYRRGLANFALGKYKLALKDFEAVHKRCPKDKDVEKVFKECDRIVRERAFLKAIATDDTKTGISEQIKVDIENLKVEDSYDGPRLEVQDGAETVTKSFMNDLLEHLRKQKKLHRKYAYRILLDVKKVFQAEKSLVYVDIPQGKKFTVCGDIHGQYYDLLNIFKINDCPSETNAYLFNGDFVDRGSFSVECILVLFGYKLLYPGNFFMSRGNHESETMNQMYGFYGEVKAKYTSQMADLFTEVFNLLPLAHILSDSACRIMVMHGGLFSEDNVTLDDIEKIDRNRQPPEEGLMCDLLWSDPCDIRGRSASKRGVGIQFGPDVTENFLKQNDIDYIIRSHEVKAGGYEEMHNKKCITVFSAPNYCDQMGNKGGIVILRGGNFHKPSYKVYDAVDHPAVKPMQYANSLFGFM